MSKIVQASVMQPALIAAAKLCKQAVATRPTLPVLGFLLLEINKDTLTISGTDLEKRVDVVLPARTDQVGGVCVDAKRFCDMVAKMPKERVDLTIDRAELWLKCGPASGELMGIPDQEFPIKYIERDDDEVFGLTVDDVRSLLTGVAHAVAADGGRPILTGMLFRGDDEKVVTAAADGFRLAVREVETDKVSNIQVVISGMIAKPLKTAMTKLEGDVPVRLRIPASRSRVELVIRPDDVGDWIERRVAVQCIEGNFVNYEQIIPNGHRWQVQVERQDMIKGLTYLNTMAKDEAWCIRSMVNDRGMHLAVQVMDGNGEYDLSSAVVERETDEAELEIAYNGSLMLECLKSMHGSVVTLEMTVGNRPIKVTGTAGELEIIMPMHVRSLSK